MKMFIKNLACRLKYLCGGVSIFWKTIGKAVTFLGFLVTVFEILNTLYKDNFHFEFLIQNFMPISAVLLLVSFLLSLNYKFAKTFSINGCDAKITIKIGNIVKERGSFVIPTNTSFITIREAGFISKKSVQGQFEDKYYHNSLSTLDSLISDSLKSAKTIKRSDIKGKKYNVYPSGTIAQIHNGEQSIYFLALNDVNGSGQNSSGKIEDYYNAIAKLWNYIERFGHTDDLAVPLIGSGRASIEGLTKERVAFDLVDTFITISINKKICTSLIIYICPLDLETIDVKRLFEYTDFKTKYIRENRSVTGTGVDECKFELDEDPSYDYYEEEKLAKLEEDGM